MRRVDPSSTIPIFIPCPAVPSVGPQRLGALISLTLRSSSGRYLTLGHTFATPGTEAEPLRLGARQTTAKPFATTVYRHRSGRPGPSAMRD